MPPPPPHPYQQQMPQQQMPMQQAGGPGPAAQQQQQAGTKAIPLERVIDDVAAMGFSRADVRAAVASLMSQGQSVDLNVVLDRLMNGPRR